MNLYREVKSNELVDLIDETFDNYLVRDCDAKYQIERAVKNLVKKDAKKVIKYYFADYQDWSDCHNLYKDLKKLYKARGLIENGEKIYTEL